MAVFLKLLCLLDCLLGFGKVPSNSEVTRFNHKVCTFFPHLPPQSRSTITPEHALGRPLLDRTVRPPRYVCAPPASHSPVMRRTSSFIFRFCLRAGIMSTILKPHRETTCSRLTVQLGAPPPPPPATQTPTATLPCSV